MILQFHDAILESHLTPKGIPIPFFKFLLSKPEFDSEQ